MLKFQSALLQTSGRAQLKNSAVLQAEGADAATFLQGQFSQDIARLQTKESCFAGLSNPKGRLIANCYVYKISDDCYFIILPSAMLPEVQKQLTKYVMRSKVKFSQREDLYLYGLWNKELENLQEFENYFKLTKHANLYIGISGKEIISALENETAWELQLLLNVIPEVSPQTQERFVAQMLNMDVLNGISFNKGCYTGQEVIARMQHLGRVKRRTLLLESQQELLPGEKIKYENTSIGEVLNCIPYKGIFYSLAVMQLDKLKHYNADDLLKNSRLTVYITPYKLEQII